MKGLKAFSDRLKKEQNAVNGRNIWIPLYYNSENDTVYATSGNNRELVTHFLNSAEPSEIKETVIKWLWR